MPRIARIIVEGLAYHITQRGNGRQQVFFTEADYRLYLDLLRANARSAGLDLWGYCLMPNHVHLIGFPRGPESMARALGRTHADYARYFNLQRRSCGHVWQARYFSCPLASGHLWKALAYVERNPVRARLAHDAAAHPWSSAVAHLQGHDEQDVLDLNQWSQLYSPRRWGEVLRTSVNEESFGERLHQATRHGRPLGDDVFVTELEQKSGRPLKPKPPGRPRKEDGKTFGIGICVSSRVHLPNGRGWTSGSIPTGPLQIAERSH